MKTDSIDDPDRFSNPLRTPAYSTDPEKIADVLNKEWSSVFSLPSQPLLVDDEFLSVVQDFARCNVEDVSPSVEEVEQVILRSKDSSPGPDGIPYSIYAVFPTVTIALVLVFISALMSDGFVLDPGLLLSFMVFLPKKVVFSIS